MLPKVLMLRKPKKVLNGVRIYAKVASRDFSSRLARDLNLVGYTSKHYVVFLVGRGIRRWLCDCQSFLFRYAGRRRHCDHIKAVRRKLFA